MHAKVQFSRLNLCVACNLCNKSEVLSRVKEPLQAISTEIMRFNREIIVFTLNVLIDLLFELPQMGHYCGVFQRVSPCVEPHELMIQVEQLSPKHDAFY